MVHWLPLLSIFLRQIPNSKSHVGLDTASAYLKHALKWKGFLELLPTENKATENNALSPVTKFIKNKHTDLLFFNFSDVANIQIFIFWFLDVVNWDYLVSITSSANILHACEDR